MSNDKANEPAVRPDTQQVEEKSLLGSSYSYQQGVMQVSTQTANELAVSDDD
jgi:hypothetical protein